MSTELDYEDVPDSKRIGDEAKRLRDDPSDPGGELRSIAVRLDTHERSDAARFKAAESRWKQAGLVFGLLVTLAGWGAQQAWAAHADAAESHAQIDDMHERVVRIEQQIDRLMERTDR